ncbi:Phage-related holin (Lysis protein) [Ruminococcaceae bacterium FB2012]|nr:Phage-related holin (Lysis protein) [Ruminococcaceae bacterium FB2012]
MKYIIMLLIVIGAAFTDFVTGFIKAYGKNEVSSRKMRIGGLNKLCEIIVTAASAGLGIGLEQLGRYYDSPQLTELAGSVTAFGTFFYITLMETVSVLENFAAIRPEAKKLKGLIRHLKLLGGNDKPEDEYNDSEGE